MYASCPSAYEYNIEHAVRKDYTETRNPLLPEFYILFTYHLPPLILYPAHFSLTFYIPLLKPLSALLSAGRGEAIK